jgi:hypothetical protein
LGNYLWGACPPNPLGRLRRGFDSSQVFCEAEQTFFASFLEKEECYAPNWFFGGHAPQTPWVGFAEASSKGKSSAKQNYRFLLLFLEKEEYP